MQSTRALVKIHNKCSSCAILKSGLNHFCFPFQSGRREDVSNVLWLDVHWTGQSAQIFYEEGNPSEQVRVHIYVTVGWLE